MLFDSHIHQRRFRHPQCRQLIRLFCAHGFLDVGIASFLDSHEPSLAPQDHPATALSAGIFLEMRAAQVKYPGLCAWSSCSCLSCCFWHPSPIRRLTSISPTREFSGATRNLTDWFNKLSGKAGVRCRLETEQSQSVRPCLERLTSTTPWRLIIIPNPRP